LSARFGRHTRLDNLDQKRRNPASRGPYTDSDHRGHEDDIEGRQSDAFEVPSEIYGAQNGASYSGASRAVQAQGYAVPEAQFAYGEDTGYHGGHVERAMN